MRDQRLGFLTLVVSWALILTGLTHVALGLATPGFGTPEWEIAFFGQASASLALPVIGFAGLAIVGALSGRRLPVAFVGVAMVLIGVLALVGVVIVVTDAPLVWTATSGLEGVAARGYRLVTVKALTLCLVYAIFGVVLGYRMLRTAA